MTDVNGGTSVGDSAGEGPVPDSAESVEMPVVEAPVEVVPPVVDSGGSIIDSPTPIAVGEPVDAPVETVDNASEGPAIVQEPEPYPPTPEPQPADVDGTLIPVPEGPSDAPGPEQPNQVVLGDAAPEAPVEGQTVVAPEAEPEPQQVTTETVAPPTPEPGVLIDAQPGPTPTQTPTQTESAAAPVVDSAGEGPVDPNGTADEVIGMVPSPSSVGEDDDKPLPSPEAIQEVRDLMPADVEQVIRAIAKEAAAEVVTEMVVEEAITAATLAEPGTPTS